MVIHEDENIRHCEECGIELDPDEIRICVDCKDDWLGNPDWNIDKNDDY